MDGRPHAEPDLSRLASTIEIESPDEDIVWSGRPESIRWQLPGERVVVAALAVVAVIIASYLVGRGGVGGRDSSPARPFGAAVSQPASPAFMARSRPVDETGHLCSVEVGAQLEMGVEIINQSADAVTLERIRAISPMGGLQATATAAGTCGQVPDALAVAGYRLAPGSTTWLTTTFDVLVNCPGAPPPQFELYFTRSGRADTASLVGFVDLGDIPYSGCQSP